MSKEIRWHNLTEEQQNEVCNLIINSDRLGVWMTIWNDTEKYFNTELSLGAVIDTYDSEWREVYAVYDDSGNLVDVYYK